MSSSSDNKRFKVTLVGASGGIGQTLALLLKLNPKISELCLYDVMNTLGVATDLSHVSTTTKVTGFVGLEQISNALNQSDVVIIVAGIPRRPNMSREDLFHINSKIIYDIAESSAISCPNAMFLIISNPVNSNVPLFAEVLKKHNVYNSKRLFGVTTLDNIRANTFVAELINVNVRSVNVKVIGGHTSNTILPLLSQLSSTTTSTKKLSEDDVIMLMNRIKYGGDEVVNAKNGNGSATLSMAYAANILLSRLLDAMTGVPNIIECAFVENNLTECTYFSAPVRFGPDGVEEVLSYGSLSTYEENLLTEIIIPELKSQIEKGKNFALHGSM